MTTSSEPSGLTVDGIAIPLAVEAAGGDAIDAFVLEHLTAPAAVVPVEPIVGEGAEA